MAGVATVWLFAATADTFTSFVLLWLAEPQGWSGLETALIILATRIPSLVGGVAGGRAVDHFGPRRVLAAEAGMRLTMMLGFVLAGADGHLSPLTAMVLGGLAGGSAPAAYAACRAWTPRLVGPERLGSANALLGIGDQLALLMAAGLAGPALTAFGIGPAFLVPASLMVAVAAIAGVLPDRSDHPGLVGSRDVLESRSPWRTGGVLPLVALSAVYYFAYGPFESVMPTFVRDELSAGPHGYGLLWASFGLAALATLPTSAWLARRRPGLVNALGAVLWGVVTIPFVLADSVTTAIAFFMLSGAVWGPYSAVEATALQRWVHPTMHGRVFGTQRALLQCSMPLGAAVGALALDHVTPVAILLSSVGACAVAGVLALGSSQIRGTTPSAPSARSGPNCGDWTTGQPTS